MGLSLVDWESLAPVGLESSDLEDLTRSREDLADCYLVLDHLLVEDQFQEEQ